jgi:hypothetical protein
MTGQQAITGNRGASQREDLGTHRSGVDDPPNTERYRGIASLLDRLSTSKFLFRYPVLRGSLLELRSCYHRIRLLRKRGHSRQPEIGFLYQESHVPGYLVLNTQTQARTRGIQKMLDEFPWATVEDFCLFLRGWRAAEEYGASLGTQESDVCKR